jgi:hypothetical protein
MELLRKIDGGNVKQCSFNGTAFLAGTVSGGPARRRALQRAVWLFVSVYQRPVRLELSFATPLLAFPKYHPCSAIALLLSSSASSACS